MFGHCFCLDAYLCFIENIGIMRAIGIILPFPY